VGSGHQGQAEPGVAPGRDGEHGASHASGAPRAAALAAGLGRLLVGDLSRPQGGDFGARFGIIGHQTHQNGRDVDVYWPLRDGRSAVATRGGQVDQAAARALVRALLAAGAERVLVGPSIRVRGPRVRVVAGHDDHAHATF
jgi:murein endopeptidase